MSTAISQDAERLQFLRQHHSTLVNAEARIPRGRRQARRIGEMRKTIAHVDGIMRQLAGAIIAGRWV